MRNNPLIIHCRLTATIILFLSLLPAIVSAQERITVTGTVTDETGAPMIGAGILEKNAVNGAMTDLDGKYTITLENLGGTLVCSMLGYEDKEIVVGNQSVINFQMTPATELMDEVVVVGYGTQKKESVVGSISTVQVENLKLPSAQLSTALAGQLAGIVSVTRSGEPGKNGAADFYIRGISSFQGSSSPLVLVDGVERDIDLVDTDDIESFSVLKDASASAVYGVRGANGVIIITTKKGSIGRPQIKVRAEAGITSPTKMPEFVGSEQWARMYNEASGTTRYSDADIAMYANGSDPDLYPNVDWIDALYKDVAFNQRVNLSVSGGGEIARYYVSGSFYNESSIFRNAGNLYDYDSSINYNKFNFRANLDINLTNTTVLNLNLANIYEKSFSPGAATSDIWSYAFLTSPERIPGGILRWNHFRPVIDHRLQPVEPPCPLRLQGAVLEFRPVARRTHAGLRDDHGRPLGQCEILLGRMEHPAAEKIQGAGAVPCHRPRRTRKPCLRQCHLLRVGNPCFHERGGQHNDHLP